jgi:hypothetical protein
MNESRGGEIYANYLPIVQSSGTGKSRMVDELAGEVFTIPLNLREADTTGKQNGQVKATSSRLISRIPSRG